MEMEMREGGQNPPGSFENLVKDVAEHFEGNLVHQDGINIENKDQLPQNLSTACIRDQQMIDASMDDVNANDSVLVNNIEVDAREFEASSPLTSAIPLDSKAEDHTPGNNVLNVSKTFDADGSGSEEERISFMMELENFYREKSMEFKPVKFYGEPLNLLKLWRAVVKLGGYDTVTASKLWRQVGESFHPPKTCTTVSWTFRIFYEKSLLEYERHKKQTGEIKVADLHLSESLNIKNEGGRQPSYGAGRARRDAAARAMQGWHVQRFSYGESAKERSINASVKRERNLKSIGVKHKKFNGPDDATRDASVDEIKRLVNAVVDVGPPADWVKISVRETRDCFEVHALVPGLLREEVRVQSDPVGRLVITGEPEQADNPWGITPFKKVVRLPARIDPLRTSAVVSLHGRLHVRVPFEHSD